MRILITGSTGYLGSYCTKLLYDEGHSLIVLKRSTSSLNRINSFYNKLILFDIDKQNLEDVFVNYGKIDLIIHIATSYGRLEEHPCQIIQANLEFPLSLLSYAVKYKVTCFINTDTYFNTGKIQGDYLDSYTLSKSQFNQWGEVYAYKYKIKFINARLEHMYGENDHLTKFVPWLVKECINNHFSIPLTLGEQKRDFIHVKDVALAYVAIVENLENIPKSYVEFGVGSGGAIELKEFVKIVHARTKSTSMLLFGELPYRTNEIMYSCADNTSLKALGWEPTISIENGINRLIEADKRFKTKSALEL